MKQDEIKNILTVQQFIEEISKVTFSISLSKKKIGKVTIDYFNDFGTYDSEVSTIIQRQEYDEELQREIIEARGLLYKWMVCIFGKYIVFGNYLDEFVLLIHALKSRFDLNYKRRIVLYVHNLEYDAQFLLGYFKTQIFATDKRSILYMLLDGAVELRCSYKLSNMSLKKFTESMNVQHQKQSGEDYDYDQIRTPDDELSDDEKWYCLCDVAGLYEAVKVKLENEGDTIASVPLTSTGYVRRRMRSAARTNPDNRRWFENTLMTPHIYSLLSKAFRGGNTHANRKQSFKINHRVYSYDVSSSYPSRLLYCDTYPIEAFKQVEIDSVQDFEDFANTHDNYCLLMNVTFYNIMTTAPIPYIAIDKCDKINLNRAIGDNGRVLAADEITLTILGQDLDIILSQYNFTGVKFNEFYYAKTAKLPKEIREVIAEFFIQKSKLKGVEGQEYFYTKNKNLLNSTYGLFVTDPVRTPITWKDGQWVAGEKNIEDQLEKFNSSLNSFLPYVVGVVCTAEARKLLQAAIDICGDNIIYVDTDSVKFTDPDGTIRQQLDALNAAAYAAAAASDVDCIGYTQDNKKQIMGVFECETSKYKNGYYNKFRTYGAKKYAVEYYKPNKEGKFEKHFEITVSGLNKSKGAEEIENIESFIIGLTIENSGRTRAIYDDNMEDHEIEVNGKTYKVRGNIAIVPTTYTLGVTPAYWNLANNEYEF